MIKKFFSGLFKIKFSILSLVVAFGFLGYFLCEYGYNNLFAKYQYVFRAEEEPTYILEVDYYNEVIAKIDDYNASIASGEITGKKISYANIDYAKMLASATLTKEGDYYILSVRKSFFPSLVRMSDGSVNKAENRVKTYFDLMLSYGTLETNSLAVRMAYYVNPLLVGGITLSLTLVGFLVTYTIMFKQNKVREILDISDNETIFKTPFHKKYWQDATTFLKKVRNVAIISVLFALMMASKLITIPSGFGSLGIGLGYLFFAVIAWCYGPIAGIVIGILSDNLGYFLFPNGYAYFPGYMLDSLLAGFIYGICFYKTKVTFTKCLWSRFFVNFFINVLLGSLWWKILYSLDMSGYLSYMLFISLPKNLLYLLPQTIVLYLVLKFLARPLARVNLVSEEVANNITLF